MKIKRWIALAVIGSLLWSSGCAVYGAENMPIVGVNSDAGKYKDPFKTWDFSFDAITDQETSNFNRKYNSAISNMDGPSSDKDYNNLVVDLQDKSSLDMNSGKSSSTKHSFGKVTKGVGFVLEKLHAVKEAKEISQIVEMLHEVLAELDEIQQMLDDMMDQIDFNQYESLMQDVNEYVTMIRTDYEKLCLVSGADPDTGEYKENLREANQEMIDDLMAEIHDARYDQIMNIITDQMCGTSSAGTRSIFGQYSEIINEKYTFTHEKRVPLTVLYEYLSQAQLMATILQVEYYHYLSGPYNPTSPYFSQYHDAAQQQVTALLNNLDRLYEASGIDSLAEKPRLVTLSVNDGKTAIETYEVTLCSNGETYYIPRYGIQTSELFVKIRKGNSVKDTYREEFLQGVNPENIRVEAVNSPDEMTELWRHSGGGAARAPYLIDHVAKFCNSGYSIDGLGDLLCANFNDVNGLLHGNVDYWITLFDLWIETDRKTDGRISFYTGGEGSDRNVSLIYKRMK